MKFLRPIINLVAFIAVAACIFTGILFIIECAIMKAGWTMYIYCSSACMTSKKTNL